jgi:hypothetical protein
VVPTVTFFIHGGDRRTTIFSNHHSASPAIALPHDLMGDTSQCVARLHRGTVVPTVIFFIHGGDRRTTIFSNHHSASPVIALPHGLMADTSQCVARLHRGTVVPTVIFFIHGGDRRTTIFCDHHSASPVIALPHGLMADTSQCAATCQSAYPGASGTIGAAILRFLAIFWIRLHEAWVAFRLQGSEFFHPDCPTSRGVVD